MSAGRAARRRAERQGKKVQTFDEMNPAWIPMGSCHPWFIEHVLTVDYDPGPYRKYTFPPFTSLSASGIEQCATLLGVHGPGPRREAMAAINRNIRKRWPDAFSEVPEPTQEHHD